MLLGGGPESPAPDISEQGISPLAGSKHIGSLIGGIPPVIGGGPPVVGGIVLTGGAMLGFAPDISEQGISPLAGSKHIGSPIGGAIVGGEPGAPV